MRSIIQKYKYYHKDREFFISVIVSFIFLALSLGINYIAGVYATEQASNAVTDIILSNTRIFDVDGIFIYGSIIFWIAVIVLVFSEPKWMPFTIKSISLFILIRSFFISLTHIGPFPQRIALDSNFLINKITFGGDLFFSGHTGLPFLMALLFWDYKYYRNFFLLASFIFGVSVILGHLHYSIDVFAAYFITYTIFHITQKIFPKDCKLFRDDIPGTQK